MESIRVIVSKRSAGEAVQNIELFSHAYDECVELRQQSKEVWMGRALLALQGLDRWEIAVLEDGSVIGGLVLAHDPWDVHVGPCTSVFAQYVLPEHRLKGISPKLMRVALRVARTAGYPTLAFTHRAGPWRYSTIYRRIHESTQD